MALKKKTRKGAKPKESTQAFERALRNHRKKSYVLKLYVAGTRQRSARAITNVKQICEEHLPDHYDLEVIDLYQLPKLAKDEQIVAVPTLIKKLPEPLRKIVGDLSDTDKVLFGLNLKPLE